jgi:hypothetical protein
MEQRDLVADRLSKAGLSSGWVSALDLEGRTIWIVDAHRDDGRRFIVHADEKLSAFVELERVTREIIPLLKCGINWHNSRHDSAFIGLPTAKRADSR